MLNFFPHIDSKKNCTLSKHSITKFSVISTIQYTLIFISTFFWQNICPYENNIRSSQPKVVEGGAWTDEYDYQNKDKKHYHYKNKNPLFFLCSLSYQNPCDSPPSYCCQFGRHLEYFTTLKSTPTFQSNSLNKTAVEYYQKIVINCDFDFRLNFSLKWRHFGHHLNYFNLLN